MSHPTPPRARPPRAATLLTVAAGALGALRWARPALAQAASPAAAPGVESACVQPTPASAFRRVPVFVHAEVVDSADRVARPTVDLMAQEVGDRLSTLIRASPGASRGASPPADTLGLPRGDHQLVGGSRGLFTGLRVVARRAGGPLAWQVAHAERADTLPADTAGAALLATALRAADREQAVFFPPEAFRGDSLVFELWFVRPTVAGRARALTSVRVRNPMPTFTLPVAWEQDAAAIPGSIRLEYPANLIGRYEGRVTLEFVVDTAGRAERTTVRDVWPERAPRPTGSSLSAYRTFVAAGRTAVINGRFRPALVAGCPVRKLVQLPLAWTMNR
jgi:hypothetical protein